MLALVLENYLQICTSVSFALLMAGVWAIIALFAGVRSLLRQQIIDVYNHYMDKGYIPIYAMENVNDMYKAYHRLGGNGTCTKIVQELTELPSFHNREE